MMLQNTLKASCRFEGKGLHTGKYAHMTFLPAPSDTGIVFRRTDLGGAQVAALAENVSNTARSTTISEGNARVITIEHVMSALTGMGVDNAFVEIDNDEVPILDGSALPYIKAILAAGLEQQDSERKYVTLEDEIEVRNDETGSFVRISPSEESDYDLTADFGSKILGVQRAKWNKDIDYAGEIGPCRTFVFFHELEYLFDNGLVRGGDVDNAIVIVEHPASPEQIENISRLFGKPELSVSSDGYLNNLELRFTNECGRHKLLDLIGDLRLSGGFLRARITAYKPGHGINTAAAKAVRDSIKQVQ